MRREATESAPEGSPSSAVMAAVTHHGESRPQLPPAARTRRPGPRRRSASRTVLGAATVAYLAFIGWITLGPQPYDPSAATVLDHVLALLRGTPVTSWVTFALTCAIELAQGAWLPTRVSDFRDVVANSAGAALGIALILAAARLRARDGTSG
jgi:VanZ like family